MEPMHQQIADRKMNRFWRVAIISPMILTVAMITAGSSTQPRVDVSALPVARSASLVTPTVSTEPPNAIALSMAKSSPIRLRIAAIGLDSKLMKLGLEKDGTLQVPPTGFPAGWYTGSPTPGEIGPAVIAGHVDWNGPAVFYSLNRVRLGDQIVVDRANGTTAKFKVIRIATFLKSKFPTDEVYGNLTYPGLRLITCDDYNFKLRKYVRNTVVFAALI